MRVAPGTQPSGDAFADTWIALLRGVNVSGQRRVPMAELRRALEDAGLGDVRTYLQSGNVVFTAHDGEPQALAATIRERIASEFDHDDVAVIVLRAAELAAIGGASPFALPADADPRTLHATIFERAPEAGEFAALGLPVREGERAQLVGRAVYLLLPHGYGTTKLSNAYFERALGMAATTRNWRTVTSLVEMAEGGSDD